MKRKVIFISICCLMLLTGCMEKNSKNNINDLINENVDDTMESEVKVTNVKVIINDNTYMLALDNNKTVDEFVNLLPQQFTMNELNGNEKYVYMSNSLTTNSINPKHINAGDVMLYGDNCLVIFYKSFDTSYSYTKIGHIDNLPNLGSGSINVKIER